MAFEKVDQSSSINPFWVNRGKRLFIGGDYLAVEVEGSEAEPARVEHLRENMKPWA